MEIQHYQALFVAYGVAMIGWLLINRLLPSIWPHRPLPEFQKPWKEVMWALLASVAIVGIGQLYQHGIRLPNTGSAGPLLDCLNQLLIFSPILLLIVLRKHSFSTVWLSRQNLLARLGLGLVLAVVTIAVFSIVKSGSDSWVQLVFRVYAYENLSLAVQVFMEDIAIAALFVRFSSAIGLKYAIILVASLFAIGHIPAMITDGATFVELGSLVGDTLLGVGIIYVVQKSRDILWFWCIHFAMDMMQFYIKS